MVPHVRSVVRFRRRSRGMPGSQGDAPPQSNLAQPRSTATRPVCPTWRIAINAYHRVHSPRVCRWVTASLCTKILATGSPRPSTIRHASSPRQAPRAVQATARGTWGSAWGLCAQRAAPVAHGSSWSCFRSRWAVLRWPRKLLSSYRTAPPRPIPDKLACLKRRNPWRKRGRACLRALWPVVRGRWKSVDTHGHKRVE